MEESINEHTIPNTFFVLQAGVRLLLPQYQMQATPSSRVLHHLPGSHHSQVEQLLANIPSQWKPYGYILFGPRYFYFQSFCASSDLKEEDSLPQFFSIWIDQELTLRELAKEQQESVTKANDTNPKQLDFGFEGPEQAECFALELQEDLPSKVEAEFLHYHQCFGHVLP